MANHSDQLFSTDDWVEIYRTTDEWEVKLIQATLGNQQIRCRPDYNRKERQTTLFVAPEHQIEALELVSRIGLAITDNQNAAQQLEEDEAGRRTAHRTAAKDNQIPKATPTALEEITVAEREGIGEIVHYIGQGYELHVGPEPYNIVDEDRWEEFTDFSAQRHEFSILLKHEYPELFQWLKYGKLMGEFIRLVESTYRDVPPPRRRHDRQPAQSCRIADVESSTNAADAKVCPIAKLSLWFSLASLLAVILQLPWYASITFSLLAIGAALGGKYRIDASRGGFKGKPIALIAIIVACIVIVITWQQHQSSPSESAALIMIPASGITKIDS